MKKYSLKSLAIEITGKDEYFWDWDREYDLVRRIDKTVRYIFNIKTITDKNKDRYVRVCKFLYENDDTRLLMNKHAKIVEKTREEKIKDGVLIFQSDLKRLTNEENIKVFEVSVEFFRGTEWGYFLEERMNSMKSEEYNEVLAKVEEEVERIKMSIQGYPYREKIEKMKELLKYLNEQRLEIDKNVNDSLILPK